MTRVREATEQFLPGELDGIVFVRRSSRWPWMRSPAAPVSHATSEVLDQWIEARQAQHAQAQGAQDGADREISLEQPDEVTAGRILSAESRND